MDTTTIATERIEEALSQYSALLQRLSEAGLENNILLESLSQAFLAIASLREEQKKREVTKS
jgi:hypothetical protein